MLRKQPTLNVLIFSFGFICGSLALILFCSTAYDSYLDNMKRQFRADQSIKAIQETQAGNTVKALVCRQNIVDTFNPNAFAFIQEDGERFNFWQAIKSLVLREIKNSTYSTQGERLSEGFERGKLALLLDSIGMKSYADEEWEQAIELVGYSNKEDVFKELISKMINTDVAVLKGSESGTDPDKKIEISK